MNPNAKCMSRFNCLLEKGESTKRREPQNVKAQETLPPLPAVAISFLSFPFGYASSPAPKEMESLHDIKL